MQKSYDMASRREKELSEDKRAAMATEAEGAPITFQRKLRDDLEFFIPKPYLARASAAPDTDHPYGSGGYTHRNLSVLQQHVAFFDLDYNGIIYPWETFIGLRRIGLNIFACLIYTAFFNGSLSYSTLPGWFPSLLFPIYICNIHKGKHGSDSSVFDTEGRFMPVNLENLFSKYARTLPDRLSLKEVLNLTDGNRHAYDFVGWVSAKLEWTLLYFLARDHEGFLSKDTVRRCFDGTLFGYLAKIYSSNSEYVD